MVPSDSASEVRVRLSGPYHIGQVERIIRNLSPLFELSEPAHLSLDLTDLTFISPAALALTTAAIRRVEDAGFVLDPSPLYMPKAKLVDQYLRRMDFIRVLLYGRSDQDDTFDRKAPVGLRECQHFDSPETYPGVRKSLADAVAEKCKLERVASASIHIALDEVCENVINHADTASGGFAAAQALRSKPVMELAIADLGIGIRASLEKNPQIGHVVDDVQAVAKALTPTVTSTPERNAGLGLFVTSLLLAQNGGELLVRSGTGVGLRGARYSNHAADVTLPGTLVVLRINTDRPLDINEVYRDLDRRIKEQKPNAEYHGDDADEAS